MQIRIALCDDEPEVCAGVEALLQKILTEAGHEYLIDIFSTGGEICRKITKGAYDLLFLDIEMPDKNGVEVGSFIRETLQDEIIQIAYISAKEGYAMELFDYRPLNFLIKPIDEEKLKKVIRKYLVIFDQENDSFRYKKGYDYYSLPLSDVLYLEGRGRKVTVVTGDGTDEFYDSMERIYSSIKKHRFLFIHKSIIVNYKYIKRINYESVLMADGRELPISQSRRKEIRKRYLEIWRGENHE